MSSRDRREREREERGKDILDAAERIFFRHGQSATMDQIAAEAGVAKGTLYLYYSSKEDLFLALLGRAMEVMNQYFLDGLNPYEAPDRKLLHMAEAYIRFSQMQPEYFAMINDANAFLDQAEVSSLLLEDVYRKSSEAWAMITGFLQEGVDRGIFRNDISAFEMAVILWNNTSGLLRQVEFMNKANVWRKKRDEFSMYNLDFRRLLEYSHQLLLDGLKATGP